MKSFQVSEPCANQSSLANSEITSKSPDQDILNLIDSNLASKNFIEAESSLVLLSLKYPENPEYPSKLGHLMYKLKDYQKAETFYKLALEKSTENPQAEIYFGLGQSYFESKNYPDSLSAFSLVLNNYPDFELIYLVYLKLAIVHRHMKDLDLAVKLLSKIIENAKKVNKSLLVEALCCLAGIYDSLGKEKFALNLYMRAGKITKNFTSISCLAWAFLKINPKVTESVCRKYLRVDRPQHEWSDISFLQALSAIKASNFAVAANLLEMQLRHYPKNIIYMQYLGISYFYLGLHDKALEIFKNVDLVHPCNFENLNNLAILYKKEGLEIEAHRTYCNALMLRSQVFGANEGLNGLTILEPKIEISDFPLNKE